MEFSLCEKYIFIGCSDSFSCDSGNAFILALDIQDNFKVVAEKKFDQNSDFMIISVIRRIADQNILFLGTFRYVGIVLWEDQAKNFIMISQVEHLADQPILDFSFAKNILFCVSEDSKGTIVHFTDYFVKSRTSNSRYGSRNNLVKDNPSSSHSFPKKYKQKLNQLFTQKSASVSAKSSNPPPNISTLDLSQMNKPKKALPQQFSPEDQKPPAGLDQSSQSYGSKSVHADSKKVAESMAQQEDLGDPTTILPQTILHEEQSIMSRSYQNNELFKMRTTDKLSNLQSSSLEPTSDERLGSEGYRTRYIEMYREVNIKKYDLGSQETAVLSVDVSKTETILCGRLGQLSILVKTSISPRMETQSPVFLAVSSAAAANTTNPSQKIFCTSSKSFKINWADFHWLTGPVFSQTNPGPPSSNILVLEKKTRDLVILGSEFEELSRLKSYYQPQEAEIVQTIDSDGMLKSEPSESSSELYDQYYYSRIVDGEYIWPKSLTEVSIVDLNKFEEKNYQFYLGMEPSKSTTLLRVIAQPDYLLSLVKTIKEENSELVQSNQLILYSTKDHTTITKTFSAPSGVAALSALIRGKNMATCMETSLDKKVIMIGGGSSVNIDNSEPVLICCKFTKEWVVLDKLSLHDQKERKIGIQCLARDTNKDIFYVGVFQDIYVIEWSSLSTLRILRCIDNCHKGIIGSIRSRDETIIASSSVDKYCTTINYKSH